MIRILSTAKDYDEFVKKIPESLKALRRYVEKILTAMVSPEELLITKRLSKRPKEYSHNVLQAIAATQIKSETCFYLRKSK